MSTDAMRFVCPGCQRSFRVAAGKTAPILCKDCAKAEGIVSKLASDIYAESAPPGAPATAPEIPEATKPPPYPSAAEMQRQASDLLSPAEKEAAIAAMTEKYLGKTRGKWVPEDSIAANTSAVGAAIFVGGLLTALVSSVPPIGYLFAGVFGLALFSFVVGLLLGIHQRLDSILKELRNDHK